MNPNRRFLIFFGVAVVAIGVVFFSRKKTAVRDVSPIEREAAKGLAGLLSSSEATTGRRVVCFLGDDLDFFLSRHGESFDNNILVFRRPSEIEKSCLADSDWVILPEPWIPLKKTSPGDISSIQNARTAIFRKQDLGAQWDRTGISFNFEPRFQLIVFAKAQPVK